MVMSLCKFTMILTCFYAGNSCCINAKHSFSHHHLALIVGLLLKFPTYNNTLPKVILSFQRTSRFLPISYKTVQMFFAAFKHQEIEFYICLPMHITKVRFLHQTGDFSILPLSHYVWIHFIGSSSCIICQ